MPITYYSRTSTYTRISTRVGVGSTADFSGTPRVVDYSRYRQGTASTRVASYASFNTEPSTGYYTTTYVGDFIGNFASNSIRAFARTRTVDSTGYYSRNYIGYYTRAYQGTYTTSSAGVYARTFSGTYTRTFIGTYARGYSGTYTRTSAQTFTGEFTRTSVGTYSRTSTRVSTISGGSGAPPTYTAPASDAEYGLVVYGPDGVTEIINPTTRVLNIVFYGSISVGPYSTANITIEDVGDPTKVVVAFAFRYYDISFSVSGNTLTVINNRSTTSAPTVIAVRIA